MKRLFISSQVQYVAKDIASKIDGLGAMKGAYITSAIEDTVHSHLEWHYTNKQSMVDAGFHYDLYSIVGKSEAELKKDLDAYDFIYVEGGNAFFLLQESQKNNFNSYIKNRVENGLIYIGTSAGSVIAGPDILPIAQPKRTALAPDLMGTVGYSIVDFTVIPHWGNEDRRELVTTHRIHEMYKKDWELILLTDTQYVEVRDDFYRICDVKTKL